MWDTRKNDMNKISEAKHTLSNPERCKRAMLGVINEYPISSQQHLSKHWMNRKPWLGQAACCLDCGANEEETRIAWNFYMSKEEQDSANSIADEVIKEWELKYA